MSDEAIVTASLRAAGVSVTSVFDLVNGATPDAAMPVLVGLLGEVDDPIQLEGVIRALATPAARGVAERSLVDLFRDPRLADRPLLRWTIGSTLAELDVEPMADELLAIAADVGQGMARQMIVASLGRLRSRDPVPLLMGLLADETVAGHAATALGEAGASMALGPLRAFAEAGKGWKRKAALAAIAKIEKRDRGSGMSIDQPFFCG